jgi:hypothetical protein
VPFLPHLCKLSISGSTIALDCIPCLSSLRTLELELQLLPSAASVALLLHRLPQLHCILEIMQSAQTAVQRGQNGITSAQLRQLAQQCTRLVIEEEE